MRYVLIIHEVDDYAVWKEGFDQASTLRKSAGEIEYQVLSYRDVPNKIVHLSKWQSLGQAKVFFESDEVDKIREKLGVKAPKFIYLDELESGTL
jgi:quinol monooxygenase YgiN